jgi:hypothetical protein
MKNLLTSLMLLFSISMTSQVIKYPIDTVYYFEFPTHMDIDVARQWNKVTYTNSGTFLDTNDLYWVVDLTKKNLMVYGTKYKIQKTYFPDSKTMVVDYKLKSRDKHNRRIMFYTDEYGYEKMLFTIEPKTKKKQKNPEPNKGGWGYVKQEGGK